jgi:predicted nucleic acid-binding protein
MEALAFMPATELAARIRDGTVSAREVVEAAVRRIEAVDAQLGAFIEIEPEAALDEAAPIEPGDERPFAGVPIAMKAGTAVAGAGQQADIVIGWIQKAASAGEADITSVLSRLECRVKPLRESDMVLLARYDRFFADKQVAVHAVTDDVVEQATQLRATYSFKTPDAIHFATAVVAGADCIVTSDRGFLRCPLLRVELV